VRRQQSDVAANAGDRRRCELLHDREPRSNRVLVELRSVGGSGHLGAARAVTPRARAGSGPRRLPSGGSTPLQTLRLGDAMPVGRGVRLAPGAVLGFRWVMP